MQSTLRLTLSLSRQPEVRDILAARGYEFVAHDHAFWRAKGRGHTVVFFKSGALLLQGDEAVNRAIAELLGEETRIFDSPEKEDRSESGISSGERILGMDESGKGDLFGPLVLAAAVGTEKELAAFGVADCKLLTDERVESVFRAFEGHITWKVRVIEPAEYNALYPRTGNLNRLLAGEYAALLSSMEGVNFDHAVLDRFSPSAEQNAPIVAATHRPLTIIPRAEAVPAVAAASIVARCHFVRWMEEASHRLGREIPKGAGSAAARLFHELRGQLTETGYLSYVKAHFQVRPV
jgi:ribonuclease HIII